MESDVSISKPVVQTSDHSNDLTAKSSDNVNEAEKDETGKDPDAMSTFSDTEGGKGKPGVFSWVWPTPRQSDFFGRRETQEGKTGRNWSWKDEVTDGSTG